jgi:hypothetical protein
MQILTYLLVLRGLLCPKHSHKRQLWRLSRIYRMDSRQRYLWLYARPCANSDRHKMGGPEDDYSMCDWCVG